LELIEADVCAQPWVQTFFKSYSNWDKMTMEQRHKALACLRKLPKHLRNIILQTAKLKAEQTVQESLATNNQTTKDDKA
jgi:hypothetical protein